MSLNRKRLIQQQADKLAESRDQWIKKNSYFYNDDRSYMKFLVGENARVLELGCGTGQLLNFLNPSYGVGVDLSSNIISIAK
ncbi:glycosyl transferase, partial [bacterium]|nr:glycosyl transferase [bacterium]